MKRFKFILLTCIVACMFGCQKQNMDMDPIDNYIVKEPEVVSDDTDVNPPADEEKEEESIYEKGTPDYIFDQFMKGKIDAEVLNPLEPKEWGWDYDKIKTVNINDLNDKHILWSFMNYSEGERLDLDNDGEDELIIDGPYGGMYLDVIDGKLYVFAAARGNAGSLEYVYYKKAYWIVYEDITHGGRLCYWLYKYEGADNVVDTMTLMGFWNSEDDKEFTFNDEQITEEDYHRIHDEIFNPGKATHTQANNVTQVNYTQSEEVYIKLVSYLVFLENYKGLPEDTIGYEIVYTLGEQIDNTSTQSDDFRKKIASHRMPTSDLNIFLQDVLKSNKKYATGYKGISEVGVLCEDDDYSYAYNGVGWGEYEVIKNVNKTADSIEVEADIMNAFDEVLVCTIKFSLKTADNKFGYTLDRDSIIISQ